MTITPVHKTTPNGDRGPAGWRAAVWPVASVRWAAIAVALFLAGLCAQLVATAAVVWWALYLACYLTGGWESAWAGLRTLRNKALDVDLLMIVAAIGAAAIGQILDGALLIVIFTASGALADVATKRTEDSVKALLDLAPEGAVVIDDDGREQVVAAAGLRVGDRVVVRPGERIAADGAVVFGSSEVDQSSISGEGLPVDKTRGDEVFAGSLNGSGTLRLVVTRDPSQTVVARIVTMVAQASAAKAETQLFIERVERRYSVGVVVATLALFTVPLLAGDQLQPALLRAMTFMIVASPCAVVLATMPPLLCVIANAGRHGVLIKSAVVVEHLADTCMVVLDKTGTLTRGTPCLTTVEPLGAHNEQRLLQLAAAAEQFSEHPLGRAITEAARRRGIPIPAARDFRALPGRGVRATVADHRIEICRPDAGQALIPQLGPIHDSGATAVIVMVDGTAVGVLGLVDQIRCDAADSVATLTTLSCAAPVLLTGDNHRAAAHVAYQTGISDVRAALLPDQKVDAVRDLQANGHRVLVVGDGVNDAPAMAAARTSVAMGVTGADLTLQTADGVTIRDELHTIPTVIALARRARRVVIANLAIAATFITVLVVWDLCGHLPLPLGVAGHEGSTVIVALNGMRLLTGRAWRTAAGSAGEHGRGLRRWSLRGYPRPHR